MAKRERLVSVARHAIKIIRKRPWLSATALAFLFMLIVPVQPFVPECRVPGRFEYQKISGSMSSQYIERAKSSFRRLGVYYWHIGDAILLRILPFLDGSDNFGQSDAIYNSGRGAASSLITEYRERLQSGVDPTAEPDPIPVQFVRLFDAKTKKLSIKDGDCRLMHLVITGHMNDEPSQ